MCVRVMLFPAELSVGRHIRDELPGQARINSTLPLLTDYNCR